MYAQFIEAHAQIRLAELRQEAEHQRLIDRVKGPSRPLRSRVAAWLVVVAAWIEGAPRVAVFPATEGV
jgi:hypothetical protein